ncbi:MAG: hypothetical protein FIB06_12440 [Betaproteobacteria bacterium]|nr:hypothetical protein [Betaproteobacteria bacterium]
MPIDIQKNLPAQDDRPRPAGGASGEPLPASGAADGSGSLKRIFILEAILIVPWLIFVFPAWMAVAYGGALGLFFFVFAAAFVAYPVIALAFGVAAVGFRKQGDDDMAAAVAGFPIACLVPFGLLMLFR